MNNPIEFFFVRYNFLNFFGFEGGDGKTPLCFEFLVKKNENNSYGIYIYIYRHTHILFLTFNSLLFLFLYFIF
jgi:hypothetical protein